MDSAVAPVLWFVFALLVAVSLVLDLGIHHKHRSVGLKTSLIWVFVWIALAIAFGFGVSPFIGATRTIDYFTAYLLEKALSVDNLFVFIVIFGFFGVPREHQHQVLFWGILGALVMRAIFIFVGVALLQRFHFLFWVFGLFLIYTGIKLGLGKSEEIHPEKNLAFRAFRKIFPVSNSLGNGRFFVVENGRRLASRLMVVLVVVEATDVVFAVDSIPAVLAVTTDPFVIYTSNIFAILGLRALYFVLSGVMVKFRYLNIGLAFVLSFIGIKMLVSQWLKVPPVLSLLVVGSLLAIAVIASLIANRRARTV
jgi:tellurite resistance protein TerC